jgi:hypothetical protein
MQRNGGALPIAGAIATLPLVLADGGVLAEPGSIANAELSSGSSQESLR